MVHWAAQALALGDVPLGIVPAGAGNDSADVPGIPRDPPAAADAVLAALDTQYGGEKKIAAGARMDDGQFLVAHRRCGHRRMLARMAPTLPRAGHLGHPALALHVARAVLVPPGITPEA